MSDGMKPDIRHQKITQNITILDGAVSALMEDTVYTMEDASTVMSGPTTPIGPINWTIVKPRIDGR